MEDLRQLFSNGRRFGSILADGTKIAFEAHSGTGHVFGWFCNRIQLGTATETPSGICHTLVAVYPSVITEGICTRRGQPTRFHSTQAIHHFLQQPSNSAESDVFIVPGTLCV
jgi:hypothetical protein